MLLVLPYTGLESMVQRCNLELHLMRILAIFALLCALTSLALAQPTINVSPAKLDCPGIVLDVAFSPDGKLLAAGFGAPDQSGVRIWSAGDLKVVTTLLAAGNGVGTGIRKIGFSPDGKLIAAANWNGDVLIWTIGSTNDPRKLLSQPGRPETLSFSRDSRKLAFTSEKAVVIYDLNSNREITLATATEHFDRLVGASFSPKTDSLFVFRRSFVEQWDTNNKRLLRTWKTFDSNFFGDVSADGTYLITGGGAIFGRKAVEIWDAQSGVRLTGVEGFRGGLFGLAIANSEKLFVAAGGTYGQEGALSLWSFKNDGPAYLPDISSASWKVSNFKPWAIGTPRELGFTSFGYDPIDELTFSPDDKQLAVATGEGFVLLYPVDRIRGPQVNTRDYALCGEIIKEENKVYIAPLAKVPSTRVEGFEYAWQFEIVNPAVIAGLHNSPVVLSDWNFETSSVQNKIRINQFQRLIPAKRNLDHIVFGDIKNPDWNKGLVTKIYQDDTFLVTSNHGQCLAYGKLDQLNTDFENVRKRLVERGLLSMAKDPLGATANHFRVRFVELRTKNVRETRSDSDSFGAGLSSAKRQEFQRIYGPEESFINALRNVGQVVVKVNGSN